MIASGPNQSIEITEGAFGAQGTVQPIEAGYYRPILRRVDGVWKITTMRITLNIPMAFPGQ
jgi:hypothetical protein